MRRDGEHRSDLVVGVFDFPIELAGVGVRCDDIAVKQGLDDEPGSLAVARPIGEAAVHDVAAGDGAGGGVLLRLVLPQDARRIVEAQRKSVVGEGRVDEYLAVDDEREPSWPLRRPVRRTS